MATSAAQFEPWFVQWVADMKKVIDETETWFGALRSKTPAFDFTSDQTTLNTQRTNLENTLITLQAQ